MADVAALAGVRDFSPSLAAFRADVLSGLSQPRKAIPPKYFYDTEGSRLFEEICELDEYYPTRTEIGILERHAEDIARLIGPGGALVEFGAGASRKVRILLDAVSRPIAFIPIDISGEHLIEAAGALSADYPDLAVRPVVADYTARFELPLDGPIRAAKRVVFFPGSTIGNFSPEEAAAFLDRTAGLLRGGGEMIVGVDRKKDRRILHAAYNDRRGVTAAFNRNLLVRINRELVADFDVGAFRHRAFYDAARGRVEMHLVSNRAQQVRIADRTFRFAAGESIHTESSHKFAIEEFRALAAAHGFRPAAVWTDPNDLFAVHYLRAT